jgi:hypothetical protein
VNLLQRAIPPAPPEDIIAWAAESLKVDGHSFDPERTPQLLEPIRAMADAETRIGTLVKPSQGGGSTAGEVVCAFWSAFKHGLIQYNWEDDKKAKQRWEDRIQPMLKSCKDIRRSGGRFEELICEARYPNATVRVQGVFTESNLDSDTVPYQLNEELHSWKPGHLSKARTRQTQVWNSKAFDISNAGWRPKDGEKSDGKSFELWYAFSSGTMEEWETLCPGCGKYHVMRTRWENEHPELGGLRYDTEGCDMGGGRFNYNKLAASLRYQMPCGHITHNTPSERKALNKGRYSEPRNEGALVSHRSWDSGQAISYAAVDWMTVIEEKHMALRALKAGDARPWFQYITQRECRFFGEDSIPYSGQTIYNTALRKNREGLVGRAYRSATADWQQGYKAKGELQHYWLLIEDVMPSCDSQIVFEGMVESDSELLAELDAHQVPRSATWIDCSKNTKAILQLCYQNGMNAINLQLSRVGSFLHEDGVRRFYSKGKPIHLELNTPPVFDPLTRRDRKTGKVVTLPNPEEPMVVSLNKAGTLSNHFFIRNMRANVLAQNPQATPDQYISVEIPSDVSGQFKKQNESWEYLPGHRPKNQDDGVEGFKQRSRNDHLLMCRAYSDFLKEWLGLLGERLAALGIAPDKSK